jgi:hypothetical protein
MKKVLFTARQLLIGILLLQLINLSLCTESYWTYYNYSSPSTYDPTETIVEWVVEWKKGNQDAFNYTHTINLKGLCKDFAWHVDMLHSLSFPLPAHPPVSPAPQKRINEAPLSACIETLSPPPEGPARI